MNTCSTRSVRWFTRACNAAALSLLLLIFLGSISPVVAADKPNLIFILIDDMGWTDLGCYGSKYFQTPNIDQLASEGMKFTQAYAACPVCSPTRASILTGKYPARLHLTDWLPGKVDKPDHKLARPTIRQQLPLEETTIAEVLKPAGYVSASIGKWHLGGKEFDPEKQGFDVNVAGNHNGSPASYFSPYHKGTRTIPLSDGRPGEYLTDRLTDEALKFIETNKDKPFFVYLPFYAVHIPLQAKEELIEKYKKINDPRGLQKNPVYAAMIESVDQNIGRLMQKLKELNLASNTVVFFTSDNGGVVVPEGGITPTSNVPLRAGKGYLYEGGIREPLIVRWPGVIKEDTISTNVVSSVDYFPTICELAGVRSTNKIDGVSLVPVLKQTRSLPARELYWHYPHYANQGGRPGGVIREGDFKLIEWYETGAWELYDLKNDLSEKTNVVQKHWDQAVKMQMKLDQWRRYTGAQMMLPNPDYDPKASSSFRTILE
ncbi:MAG: atsA 1 [Verrucomicrobiales bacterium]|nr:atsA 1 [Verrucomicrobiales bacterium]